MRPKKHANQGRSDGATVSSVVALLEQFSF